MWDLASLSKILGTASAMAVLAAESRVDLDAPVNRYLPEFGGGGKDLVTVRMLLDHTSGLPAYAQLYRAASSEAAIAKLCAVPLQREVGATPIYSDLNALLSGLVIERVSGSHSIPMRSRRCLRRSACTHHLQARHQRQGAGGADVGLSGEERGRGGE